MNVKRPFGAAFRERSFRGRNPQALNVVRKSAFKRRRFKVENRLSKALLLKLVGNVSIRWACCCDKSEWKGLSGRKIKAKGSCWKECPLVRERERECKMSERPLSAYKILAPCDEFRIVWKSENEVVQRLFKLSFLFMLHEEEHCL